jgi:hypothetical protein
MDPRTCQFAFRGLAPALGTSAANLERASRPLKQARLWPVGRRGVGPRGDGLEAQHLSALLLSQAADQATDAVHVFQLLSSMRAVEA